MSFINTEEHDIIEATIKTGVNTLVDSGPGSGKTTLIKRKIVPIMLQLHKGNGAAMALNVANAKELNEAINNPRVTCATVCASLWRIYKAANPLAKVQVFKKAGPGFKGRYQKQQDDKMTLIADKLFQKEIADGISMDVAILLVSHAKKSAFGIPGHPSIDDRDAWKELAKRHVKAGIENMVLENNIANAGDEISEEIDQQITYAIKLLEASNKDVLTLNFDDQLYLPMLLNTKLPHLDFIIYDEFQDIKPVEVEYLRRLVAAGTQVIGVGDEKQYAYEFAGALFNAFKLMSVELNMTICSMRVSWRCSVTAARLANGVFPDSVIPAPNAKIGQESRWDYASMFDAVKSFDCNHGLLSRTHKNLMPAALMLLAAKMPFWYKGVKELVQKMERMLWHHSGKKELTDLKKIRESMTEYQAECEIKHLTVAGNTPKWVQDQGECIDSLNLLLVNCETAGEGIDCVKQYLKTLGECERKTLNGPALCTIHVSKGLEWQNVYVIGECRSALATTEEQLYAEKCLEFVAYSRSSENVIIVSLEKADSENDRHVNISYQPE